VDIIKIPERKEHPFKKRFKDKNIRLVDIVKAFNYSYTESYFCTLLNGDYPMSDEIKEKLEAILRGVENG
jgi:hypothetical protein